MKKLSTRILTIYCVALVIGSALLIAASPYQTGEPPAPVDPTPVVEVVPEPGEPPVSPPDNQGPDYAGFIATSALVLAATAFAKERLGLQGPHVLYTAFGIVLAVAFYPDLVGALPAQVAGIVDKFVYGVLIPFISATGCYDLAQGFSGLFKPKGQLKPPPTVINASSTGKMP